ncbi:hypothetical protein BDV93DRAFT_609881 [Ceratobasidium sp. AG-I]|nr:hypothetical protein BDV93DRAFT_609881 [Ceratobasidium sp. AG-I]
MLTKRFFVPTALKVDTLLGPFIDISEPYACVENVQKKNLPISINLNVPDATDDLETLENTGGPAGQTHEAEDKKLPDMPMHRNSKGDPFPATHSSTAL